MAANDMPNCIVAVEHCQHVKAAGRSPTRLAECQTVTRCVSELLCVRAIFTRKAVTGRVLAGASQLIMAVVHPRGFGYWETSLKSLACGLQFSVAVGVDLALLPGEVTARGNVAICAEQPGMVQRVEVCRLWSTRC